MASGALITSAFDDESASISDGRRVCATAGTAPAGLAGDAAVVARAARASPSSRPRRMRASFFAEALRRYTTCVWPDFRAGMSSSWISDRIWSSRPIVSVRTMMLFVRKSGTIVVIDTIPGTCPAIGPVVSAPARVRCIRRWAMSIAEAYFKGMTATAAFPARSILCTMRRSRRTLSAKSVMTSRLPGA